MESEGREVGKPGPNDITGLLDEALPDWKSLVMFFGQGPALY